MVIVLEHIPNLDRRAADVEELAAVDGVVRTADFNVQGTSAMRVNVHESNRINRRRDSSRLTDLEMLVVNGCGLAIPFQQVLRIEQEVGLDISVTDFGGTEEIGVGESQTNELHVVNGFVECPIEEQDAVESGANDFGSRHVLFRAWM